MAELPKLAYTLAEFRAAGGPCRVRCYELWHAGKLKLVKDGNRTLVTATEAQRWLDSLQSLQHGEEQA